MMIYVFLNCILEIFFFYSILCILDRKNRLGTIQTFVIFTALALPILYLKENILPYHMVFVASLVLIPIILIKRGGWQTTLIDGMVGFLLWCAIQIPVLAGFKRVIGDAESGIVSHLIILPILIVGVNLVGSLRRVQIFFDLYRKNREIGFFISMGLSMMGILGIQTLKIHDFLFEEEMIGIFTSMVLGFTITVLMVKNLRKKAIAQRENELIQIYGAFQGELIDRLKEREHQYNGHLNILMAMVERVAESEQKEEIQNYIGSCRRDKILVDGISDDTVISGLIFYYNQHAKALGVRLESRIQREIPKYNIDKNKLVEILSNLLDNALEEAMLIEDEGVEKKIEISIEEEIISISNPICEEATKEAAIKFKKRGYSSKGTGRGYGLVVVGKIVKKYGIGMEIEIIDGQYIVTLDMAII